ncbi:staphylocoagulase [Staphylococcus aureus]|uniref:staphylocoagulase n=2 Tax=Staphylococcus aureus TaxID=1280 RepID=UPI000D0F9F5D|nr:staphylocoagulase [Staphylococcus aureus]AXJ44978.1 Staphylocoagulase precursor [Staphylococcus aureus]AXJ47543.1 Staphylocoagulase precursor [Staphylococcus aureus]MBO8823549.1 staphylocoagulase [Staphylococcus aureus]PSH97234.1 coagulase [Staphylococcus aureus]QHL38675.1 staphylocoagulase [Staphylococcus aureus]
MKKQIISLGALAVASSLFTWDNKADAIVTKDYSKESRVNENSKYDSPMSNWYYWGKVKSLESQFADAIDIIEDYQYGEKEYKDAKDKLMTRILGEDQYLLKKKIEEYKQYRERYLKAGLSPVKFYDYNLYDFTMKEYNDIHQSLKDAVEEFYQEVKHIQSKNSDLQTYDKKTEDKETDNVYSLVSEIDTIVATYYGDKNHGEHAKELRAKLDIILGEEKKPNRITNERIRKEMTDDLNSIIDDFFMETGQNRPVKITKYNPNIHSPKDNKESFDKLVEETKKAVKEADESWKTKTVKTYGETETKAHVVKEEKKVEEPQLPKVGNQQEDKTTVGTTEKAPLPIAQPLVKLPQIGTQGKIVEGPKYPTMEQHTIYGEIVKGPDYLTMENKTLQGEIVQGPDFPTMEQNRPALSDNYTNPTLTNPILKGIEGNSTNLEIKPQGTESTLKGIQGESSDIEVKPQATETTEASHYPARPQFNKTPKYVKYRDAGTGIREYNDGTFGYEVRPRFNKPSETNAYNVMTNQDGTVSYGARPTQNKASETNAYNVTTHANGQVSYGARPTQKKPSETNAYNVTTHANGQVSYGARPTYKKPSETNAYNVTTHANGQVSYGARPTQNKPSNTNAYNVTTHANGQVSYGARPTQNKASETNAYNVTTHANGQVSYGARPTQNKPSETNAYNVTTHGNGQVSYGARPTYNKPSKTNAYNVTTHADGTATYGPRVTK